MDNKKIGTGQTAMVTGASSGIGEELATCFAEGGFDLLLVARSADKLKLLADSLSSRFGIKATVLPADLLQPDSVPSLATTLKRKKLAIDVLVNNAGVMEQGNFWSIPAAKQQQMIDLNISGLTALLTHFVPDMVKRERGKILNVASIAAFQPVPTVAVYAATKAYVLSLTESLSVELKPKGITVTALCPGITETNMFNTFRQSDSMATEVPKLLIGDARTVAREGYDACIKGEVIKVPGAINRAAMLTSRATPKWLIRLIGDVVSRKTTKR